MALRVLWVVCALLVSGCMNVPPRPRGNLDNILNQHYYECPKCRSLDGGYYGKGSVSSWRSERGKQCRHRWRKTGAADFDARWRERVGNSAHY